MLKETTGILCFRKEKETNRTKNKAVDPWLKRLPSCCYLPFASQEASNKTTAQQGGYFKKKRVKARGDFHQKALISTDYTKAFKQ